MRDPVLYRSMVLAVSENVEKVLKNLCPACNAIYLSYNQPSCTSSSQLFPISNTSLAGNHFSMNKVFVSLYTVMSFLYLIFCN